MGLDLHKSRCSSLHWITWSQGKSIEQCQPLFQNALLRTVPDSSHWKSQAHKDTSLPIRDRTHHKQGKFYPWLLRAHQGGYLESSFFGPLHASTDVQKGRVCSGGLGCACIFNKPRGDPRCNSFGSVSGGRGDKSKDKIWELSFGKD